MIRALFLGGLLGAAAAAGGCVTTVLPGNARVPTPSHTAEAAVVAAAHARVLNDEIAALDAQRAALEHRTALLRAEARDFRVRAFKARRTPYLLDETRESECEFYLALAKDRDAEADLCERRIGACRTIAGALEGKRMEILNQAAAFESGRVVKPK